MPSGPQWRPRANARYFRSSKEEMPRANKNEDEHKQRKEKTADDLLGPEFHFCW
jgi:hypothetical protein